MQVVTRTLEPQMVPSPVHTGRLRLRGEICRQRTRTPSQTNPRRKLQSHTGMERTTIHRHHLRLGLQAPTSPFIHAWIHQKGSQTIQAQEAQTATSTIPQRHHRIWGKDTICHCAINLTAVKQTRQEIHPPTKPQYQPTTMPCSTLHTSSNMS